MGLSVHFNCPKLMEEIKIKWFHNSCVMKLQHSNHHHPKKETHIQNKNTRDHSRWKRNYFRCPVDFSTFFGGLLVQKTHFLNYLFLFHFKFQFRKSWEYFWGWEKEELWIFFSLLKIDISLTWGWQAKPVSSSCKITLRYFDHHCDSGGVPKTCFHSDPKHRTGERFFFQHIFFVLLLLY